MDYDGWGWKPYVSVAERRRKALRAMEKRKKQGHAVSPIVIDGRNLFSPDTMAEHGFVYTSVGRADVSHELPGAKNGSGKTEKPGLRTAETIKVP